MSNEAVINLGIGIPELVSSVANEEGIGDSLTMTVEAGAIGGIPLGGVRLAPRSMPKPIWTRLHSSTSTMAAAWI